MTNHRAPLQPGEVRTQWVGNQLFQVMHVAGGSMTQASVRESGQPTRVIRTDSWEHGAVNAYADAIELAENAEAPGLGDVPQNRSADGVPEVEQQSAPAPTLADNVAALREAVKALPAWDWRRHDALTRLDRIAARAPQRATDKHGDLLWQHYCGVPAVGKAGVAPQYCPGCRLQIGAWRALYTLPDGA